MSKTSKQFKIQGPALEVCPAKTLKKPPVTGQRSLCEEGEVNNFDELTWLEAFLAKRKLEESEDKMFLRPKKPRPDKQPPENENNESHSLILNERIPQLTPKNPIIRIHPKLLAKFYQDKESPKETLGHIEEPNEQDIPNEHDTTEPSELPLNQRTLIPKELSELNVPLTAYDSAKQSTVIEQLQACNDPKKPKIPNEENTTEPLKQSELPLNQRTHNLEEAIESHKEPDTYETYLESEPLEQPNNLEPLGEHVSSEPRNQKRWYPTEIIESQQPKSMEEAPNESKAIDSLKSFNDFENRNSVENGKHVGSIKQMNSTEGNLIANSRTEKMPILKPDEYKYPYEPDNQVRMNLDIEKNSPISPVQNFYTPLNEYADLPLNPGPSAAINNVIPFSHCSNYWQNPKKLMEGIADDDLSRKPIQQNRTNIGNTTNITFTDKKNDVKNLYREKTEKWTQDDANKYVNDTEVTRNTDELSNNSMEDTIQAANEYNLLNDLQNVRANITFAQLFHHAPSIRTELKKLMAFPSKQKNLIVARMASPDREHTLKLSANGIKLDCIIDGGANVNLLAYSVAKKLRVSVEKSTGVAILTASNVYLTPLGIARNIHIKIEGYSVYCDFYVVNVNDYDMILGRPFLKKTNSTTNWKNNTYEFTFGNDQVQICLGNEEIPECRRANIKLVDASETENAFISRMETKYPYLFELKNDPMRKCNVEKHAIDVGSEKAIAQKLRRFPPTEKKLIEEYIQEAIQQGIIRESKSPWRFNIVIVPKKDGTKRVCIDYRQLNTVTKKNSMRMPNIEEILEELEGSNIFSTIDLKSGYHQIQMENESVEKTAFGTHVGNFEYLVMPFGLCNAPSTFQYIMEKILHQFINSFVCVYLDDIVVYSKSKEDHIMHLEQVLEALDNANLKLNNKKCYFFMQEVELLGFKVNSNGIAIGSNRLKIIDQLEEPMNLKELRSVLGLFSYLRKFVPHFAKESYPMTECLKSTRPWKWTKEASKSFYYVKELLKENSFLAHPNMTAPFDLYCDASKFAIGAILMQDKKIVACASRKLNPAELNYCVTEKECLAIYFALKKFRHYLLGTNFNILTDHKCLTSIWKMRDPSGRIARWLLTFAEYNMEIKYVEGKSNVLADQLSRSLCFRSTATDDLEILRKVYEEKIPFESLQPGMKKKLLRLKKKFVYANGNLLKNDLLQAPKKVVFDQEEKEKLMKEYHDYHGHFGVTAVFDAIYQGFYWPQMFEDIKLHIQGCPICSTQGKPRPEKLIGTVPHAGLFDLYAVDFSGC